MGVTVTKVKCMKCGKEGEALTAPPYPSALGNLILKSNCKSCLEEWKKFSVMVINDFKLKPFLPQDRAVLEQHMRQFLNLEGAALKQPQVLTGQGKQITFETAKMDPLQEKVIDLLKQIFDPEVPVNIYDLGLIYEVRILGKTAQIKMTLTTQHCPAAQSLPATVKEAIGRVSGIDQVDVQVVWDPPWSRAMISEEGKRLLGL